MNVIKLIIIGDSGVGKSCFLLRYTDDTFCQSFITTIGIDFRIKTVRKDGVSYKIQIWDTAGQERFNTITKAYYRGSMGVIIMFDVTDPVSFRNINKWVVGFRESNIPKILVANKIDLRDKTKQIDDNKKIITKEESENIAKLIDAKLFEVSVKDSIGVNESLEYLIDKAIENVYPGTSEPEINLEVGNEEVKGWCCR